MTVRKIKTGLLALSVAALSVLSGHFFISYFTDADNAANSTTIGGTNISVKEDFPVPANVTKGAVYTKKVSVVNDGPNDCYIRVKAVFSTSDIGDYATVDWNDEDFVFDPDDGYWYCKKPLKEGEETPYLFTSVSISDDIPSAALTDFDIIVYAEAYMADGSTTYQDAWDSFRVNQ